MFGLNHLHPMMVHFPIALITLGFLADILSLIYKNEKCLSKTGFYLMVSGAICAIFAYLSGEFFSRELSGIAGELKENHEIFAKIAMFTIGIAAVIRIYLKIQKREDHKLKWIVLVLSAIAVIAIGIAGYLGGSIVYNYLIPA